MQFKNATLITDERLKLSWIEYNKFRYQGMGIRNCIQGNVALKMIHNSTENGNCIITIQIDKVSFNKILYKYHKSK